LKLQAIKLAESIAAVEVNDENIRASKKLLAAVNRSVNELEDRRKKIKRLMLEPYTIFEAQVKEIVGIVKDADEIVREQVKKLEEFERMAKRDTIIEIFEKRIVHYSFRNLFSFKDFLKPKHLNKTTSIESVENEMIDFLETLAKDLKVIETMPDSEDILNLYIDVKDLAAALTLHNQKQARKQQIEASKVMTKPADKIAFLISIHAANQKELKLLEMLLQENGFEYKIDKIEKEVL